LVRPVRASGIARVDVSLDGGTSWKQADLDEQSGPWAWRQWRTTLDLPTGEVDITARAWDTSAAVQPESPGHLWNPKGYVNNSWAHVHLTATSNPTQAAAADHRRRPRPASDPFLAWRSNGTILSKRTGAGGHDR